MNWHKLKKQHLKTDPQTVIVCSNLVDSLEYDRLYENQNDLEHHQWQEFRNKYKINFLFQDDITKIDLEREVIALWFFRERSDMNKSPELNIGGLAVPYQPNTFVLTRCNEITINEHSKIYIRRPFMQLEMSVQEFDKICQNININ